MKKIITITILSTLASIANAQNVENETQEINTNKSQSAEVNENKNQEMIIQESSKISYNMGLDTYRETYTEYDTSNKNSIFMKETTNMFGMNGKTSYQATPLSQFNFKWRFAFGQAKYIGSYMGNPYGSLILDGHDRFASEFGLEHKYKYVDLNDINVGLGLTYRLLVDRLDQANDGGYKRINQLWYTKISVDKEFNMKDWKITPMFTLKNLLKGTQRSYLDPNAPLKHTQKSGIGYDVEVAFEKKICNYNLTISPYYKTMSIEDSDIVTFSKGWITYNSLEPKNKTTEVGLSVSLKF